MFWDEEATEIDNRRKALDDGFQKLLAELMNDYRSEIEKHFSSLEKELKAAIKYDAFGNVITKEGKDEEVWSYFAQKNLWENIFNKGYKVKQARYLNRLEDFLSDTIDNPDKHLESFGHGLLWRYYAKVSAADGTIVYDYMKTDDPLSPLALTLKTFYTDIKSHKGEQC
ncbi:hypothetical protein IJG90_03235 [Candidatus Saccharibacteria bacterium]|nr:hypothetical protein [Candidatus Saccharibacteria bacterium]